MFGNRGLYDAVLNIENSNDAKRIIYHIQLEEYSLDKFLDDYEMNVNYPLQEYGTTYLHILAEKSALGIEGIEKIFDQMIRYNIDLLKQRDGRLIRDGNGKTVFDLIFSQIDNSNSQDNNQLCKELLNRSFKYYLEIANAKTSWFDMINENIDQAVDWTEYKNYTQLAIEKNIFSEKEIEEFSITNVALRQKFSKIIFANLTDDIKVQDGIMDILQEVAKFLPKEHIEELTKETFYQKMGNKITNAFTYALEKCGSIKCPSFCAKFSSYYDIPISAPDSSVELLIGKTINEKPKSNDNSASK